MPTPCTTTSSSSNRASPLHGYDGADTNCIRMLDLLASEARIASFIAVSKGDIQQQSWFRLDRSHVMVNVSALISWPGNMLST